MSMSRDDPNLPGPLTAPKLFCDLTQSWSEAGGGVRTYLLHKRQHILAETPHRHLIANSGSARRAGGGGLPSPDPSSRSW